jgi:cell division protein FtsN
MFNKEMKMKRLTKEQKKALEAYELALRQEDRYLGSVFVTPTGQRQHEEKTKAAYEACKRLDMNHEHGL